MRCRGSTLAEDADRVREKTWDLPLAEIARDRLIEESDQIARTRILASSCKESGHPVLVPGTQFRIYTEYSYSVSVLCQNLSIVPSLIYICNVSFYMNNHYHYLLCFIFWRVTWRHHLGLLNSVFIPEHCPLYYPSKYILRTHLVL